MAREVLPAPHISVAGSLTDGTAVRQLSDVDVWIQTERKVTVKDSVLGVIFCWLFLMFLFRFQRFFFIFLRFLPTSGVLFIPLFGTSKKPFGRCFYFSGCLFVKSKLNKTLLNVF